MPAIGEAKYAIREDGEGFHGLHAIPVSLLAGMPGIMFHGY